MSISHDQALIHSASLRGPPTYFAGCVIHAAFLLLSACPRMFVQRVRLDARERWIDDRSLDIAPSRSGVCLYAVAPHVVRQ